LETPSKTLFAFLSLLFFALVMGFGDCIFGQRWVFGQDTPLPQLVFYVDPGLGTEEGNESGSDSRPLKSVTRALDLVAKRDVPQVAVLIKAGRTALDVSEGGAEKLPLRLFASQAEGLPTRVVLPRSLTLLSFRGWNGTATLQGPSEASLYKAPFFELELAPAEPRGPAELTVEFRRLEFSQGLSGVSLLTRGIDSKLVVLFERCRLADQAGRGIEVFEGEGSNLNLTVRDCVFETSSGGMLLETGRNASLTLLVESSIFQWIRAYGPGGILGSGVDLHFEELGNVRAYIQRNVFQGVPTAVQLTSSEAGDSPEPAKGTLVARVLSNLIGGRSPSGVPAEPGVKTGLYLSLWPHHEIDLRIANNTFVGIEGYVLYGDNTDFLRESGLFVPWTFANNICRRVGAVSEFDAEVPGESFPPAGVTIRSNLLEKSRLGREEAQYGNLSGDPAFLNEDGFDFHLQPGSVGMDRGELEYVDPFTADLDGNCRSARAGCSLDGQGYLPDLGAYESPGFCSSEPAVFRRGDCNQSSGNLEIGDAIFLFGFLFLGGEAPICADACDANDDGRMEISDGIFTLTYLFLGGRAPPPPFETMGHDSTLDCLSSCKSR
jgi:hypothetical protein